MSGEIVNIDEKQLAPSKPVWVTEQNAKINRKHIIVLGCQNCGSFFFGIESPMLIFLLLVFLEGVGEW